MAPHPRLQDDRPDEYDAAPWPEATDSERDRWLDETELHRQLDALLDTFATTTAHEQTNSVFAAIDAALRAA